MNNHHIPSISELRIITQTEKLEQASWLYAIHRKFSIYITWLLLHTSVNANQVTLFSFLVAIIGFIILLIVPSPYSLLGFLFFYAYFLLDKVDGEIARFRKQQSLRGICLDYIGHLIIPPLLPLGVGGSLAAELDIALFWLPSALAALALIFLRASHGLTSHIITAKFLKEPTLFRVPTFNEPTSLPTVSNRFFVLSVVFKVIRYFSISFWATLLLLLSANILAIVWSAGFWIFIAIFLALCLSTLIFASVTAFELVRHIDKEVFLTLQKFTKFDNYND